MILIVFPMTGALLMGDPIAIREAASQLASLFPITKGDVDDLPNNVMTE